MMTEPLGANSRSSSRLAGLDLATAGAISLAVIAAVLSPMVQNWRARPKDSFPLSYYPMFTASRGEATRITYLVGVDGEGKHHPLHYTLVGKGGLNQVRRQINRMKDEGRADKLCEQVAQKVARRKGKRHRSMVEVRVVTGQFNFNDYFLAGSKAPKNERIHAVCRIERVGVAAIEPDPGPATPPEEPEP